MGLFVLTDEQKDLQALAREFADKEIRPLSAEWDIKGDTPPDLYKKAVETGFVAAGWPQELGGLGLPYVTQAIITEELTKGDAGFANALGASSFAGRPVLMAGSDEQKKYVADIVLNGGMGAFCLTEPNAGSDAAAIKTTAIKKGDEYILNGRKCFITNGPHARFYMVFAKTDPEQRTRGISAFLVERDREGVSTGKHEDKVGFRLSTASDVVFEDVKLPAKNLIGGEGQGFKLAMKILDFSRVGVAAEGVGVAQEALDLSIAYAKERVTFGVPISKHQGIQFMLADMEMAVQSARALTYHAAELADTGNVSALISSCAKTVSSDAAMKVALDAVQIFSGYGYSREYRVEKLMRDAKLLQIFEGTNQIQRLIIAGNILH